MQAKASRWPLIILALTYWLYFGQLGVLVPYLGIFLDGRGFTSAQIGELFAVITLARIVGPSLWAGIADRSGKTRTILQIGCFFTVLSFATVFWQHSYWGLVFSFGFMMMFWTAVLPQLEVITMQTAGKAGVSYGKIRLWGSIGFIILTVAVGRALDSYSTDTPIYVSMAVLSGLFLCSLFIHQPPLQSHAAQSSGTLWSFALKPAFIIFILSATLLQVSFGPYYGFFALYMRDLDYSGQQTGLLIALGVFAEVGIFLIAQRLIQLFGVRWLLITCMMLTALRWYALADWADMGTAVVISQLIHALSFGLTHAVSVHFIHHFLPARFHSRGQALYIGIAFGLGGAVGNYLAGQLWQQGSQAYLTFAFAAVTALVSAMLLLFVPAKQWR